MSLNEFIHTIEKIWDKEVISSENLNRFDEYAEYLLEQYINGTLDSDSENALGCYLDLYEGKDVRPKAKRIVDGLENAYNAKQKEKEGSIYDRGVYSKKWNSNGIITTVALIEFVLVAGIAIALLALALL